MAKNERTETEFIPLDKLKLDSANVRSEPDKDRVLQDNLKKGQIEPIVVRPEVDTDKYLVTVGSRRLKNAGPAGLDELEAKIREDLEGEDYEAMLLSARENAGDLEVPSHDWRAVVKRCLEEESLEEEGDIARRIADKLGLSDRMVREHISALEFFEEYEWIRRVADGDEPTLVRALWRDPSDRTKEERGAIEEKFEKESDEVPCVAEDSSVLSPKRGIGIGTIGRRSIANLAEELESFKELPFREQVTVILETLQEGRDRVPKALEHAEDRVEGKKKKKKKRDVVGGHRITFRLGDEYYQLLKDYAGSKNITVPDQAAENIVMRTLDEDARGHPQITSIR